MFTDIDQTLEFNGFTVTASVQGVPQSESPCTPWDDCDGHGPVSDWTRRDKLPGELVLCSSSNHARFYDYAEACKIALRDQWGVSPYKKFTEQGANGLVKLSGHWFDARNNLTAIATDWHDDINEAYSELYASHRATMSKREYAAQAAMQDYKRLRDWCNDQWYYVGVIVTITDSDGEEIASDSLWGIESDASEDLLETANELLDQLRDSLPSHRPMIATDIGV